MTGRPFLPSVASMSVLGEARRVLRRRVRRGMPRTDVRLLGLRGRRRGDRGQTPLEYVGLGLVVVAIIGSLVATGIGQELTVKIGAQVCRITGGGDCGDGGGRSDEARDGRDGDGTAPADRPAGNAGDPGDPGGKSPEQLAYEKALKDLRDAQSAEKADQDKAIRAAKELAKILADELGITDALDCITEGDMGACTETLINVLTSLVGGAVGKLAAKYGAPWKWKKAYELVQKLKKHGGDLYDGLTGLVKNRKKVKDAQKALDDAKKKYDPDKKKPDEKKPDDKPTTCPVRHSFLPGTPVLLADGRRVAIERVAVGEKVVATDPYTGRTEARLVEQAITTYDDKHFTRLTVRTAGGPSMVTVTDTHPFWLTDEGRWSDAGDITRGNTLRSEHGEPLPVTAVSRYTERQTTHDLTVRDIHTYYVVAAGSGILVHNNDGPATAPKVDNQDLQNIINSMYKGVGNPNRVGDGSAMAAANAEALGSEAVEGKDHVEKAKQMRAALNNFLTKDEKRLKGGKKVPVVRTEKDIQIARTLMQAIDDAVAGTYKGSKNYPGLDC